MRAPPPPSTTSTPRRRLIRGAGIGLALLALAGAGYGLWWRSEAPSRRAAQAARSAVAAGRFAEALPRLDRWLAERPDAAEAHYLKARAALGLDRPEETLREVERARELGYPVPALERLVGVVWARAGRHAEAEPLLERAWDAAGGHDTLVAEALARVYLGTFRLGRALEVLDRWIADDPRNARPWLWRAEADARIDPDGPALARDYREALARDPDHPRARLGLADALRSAQKHAEAAPEYRAYLVRHPKDVEALVGAGLSARDAGDDAAAISYLDRALALDPKNAAALSGRALLAQRRGDLPRALDLLDRARASDPHNPEVRHQRSLALQRLGRVSEARAEQAEARRLRAEHEQMDKIRKRLVASPRDPDLQFEAARWLLAHDHDEEGLQWGEKILQDHPNHEPTIRLLADYFRRKGNAGRANYYRMLLPSDARRPG